MRHFQDTFRLGPWVLCYVVGIISAPALSIPIPVVGLLVVLLILGARRPLKLNWGTAWAFCWGAFLLAFGNLRHHQALELNFPPLENEEVVWIPEPPTIRGKMATYTCESMMEKGRGALLLDTALGTFKRGDVLAIYGRSYPFQKPVFPYQFNEQSYAESKGWNFRFWVEEAIRIGEHPTTSLRWYLNERIEQWPTSTRVRGFYKAMLLGVRTDLDRSDRSDFANAGLVHILAVSGLHVGLIAWLLHFLFTKWTPRRWKYVGAGLTLIGLWGFAWISGFSPSVLRATLLFSLMELSRFSKREGSSSESVWMAGFIILLFDPRAFFNLGFQLSFAAVFGILYGHAFIQRHYFRGIRGWKKKIVEGLSVSFWAQLSTTPITLFAFHRFPNYFLLSNVLMLPFVPFLLIVGILTLAVSSCLALPEVYWSSLELLVDLFFEGVGRLSRLPGAVAEGIYLSYTQALAMGGIVVALFLLLHRRRRIWLYVLPVLCVPLIPARIEDRPIVHYYRYKNHHVTEMWIRDTAWVFTADSSHFRSMESLTRAWRSSEGIEGVRMEMVYDPKWKAGRDTLISISEAP